MLSVFQQVFGDVPAARWREWGRDRQQRRRHLRQHQPQAQAVCLQVKHIKSTKHEHDETEAVVEFATTALDLLHLVKSLPSESAFPLSRSESNFKSFTRLVLSPLSPLHYFHIIVKYSSWCFIIHIFKIYKSSYRDQITWCRSKDGDWVVGTTVGNNKKGVHLR